LLLDDEDDLLEDCLIKTSIVGASTTELEEEVLLFDCFTTGIGSSAEVEDEERLFAFSITFSSSELLDED